MDRNAVGGSGGRRLANTAPWVMRYVLPFLRREGGYRVALGSATARPGREEVLQGSALSLKRRAHEEVLLCTATRARG